MGTETEKKKQIMQKKKKLSASYLVNRLLTLFVLLRLLLHLFPLFNVIDECEEVS